MPEEEKELAKKKKCKKTLKKIARNYKDREKSLVNQLNMETPNHQLTTGTYRETVWKSLFEQIIPRKFCIDQGVFIMDSHQNISAEVDLAIFDEQYTPYIFNYGKIKFIPIEAVAVVIQCKGKSLDKENLSDWVGSIKELKTSLNSVARVMTGLVDNELEKAYKNFVDPGNKFPDRQRKAQTATRPVIILCSTKPEVPKDIASIFDITLNIKNGTLQKSLSGESKSYDDWYRELNHYGLERFAEDKVKYEDLIKNDIPLTDKSLTSLKVCGKNGEENVIMSLIFQLNQMLMLINNPMLFPHVAYAEMFDTLAKQ